MKIYLLSDLHVEFHGDYPMPTSPVDVVVLAGDIDVGIGMLDVAARYAKHCKVPVIVVAGNHEYYRSDYLMLLPAFRQRAAELENVHFLEKDSVVIQDVRFLGCTLWSNFTFNGKEKSAEAKATAKRYIADFSVIEYGERKFTPDDACVEFEKSYQWLDSELAKPFDGDTVVVTHFLPHHAGVHPQYLRGVGGDHLTPYFTVDCSQLIRRHSITAWLFGHTHNSVDVTVERGTRLISNQRGYPKEAWTYTQCDAQKVIDFTSLSIERMQLEGVKRFANLIDESGGVFTIREVSEVLKRPQRDIYNMVIRGEFLAYKLNRKWCLPKAQFDLKKGQSHVGLQKVLNGFESDISPKGKVLFCLSFYEGTGKTPLQLLSEGFDPERLVKAAAAYLTHGCN